MAFPGDTGVVSATSREDWFVGRARGQTGVDMWIYRPVISNIAVQDKWRSAACGKSKEALVILDFRAATVGDADSVADVYLRSRKDLVGCAPLVRSDDDVRNWIQRRLIPAGRTTVAVVDGLVVGLLAVSKATDCSWIDQLYLHPAWVGRGIGTRLLDLARSELPPPIRLYTFQCNQWARCFYERHGFTAVAFGDGSGNEEKCPDILYEWRLER